MPAFQSVQLARLVWNRSGNNRVSDVLVVRSGRRLVRLWPIAMLIVVRPMTILGKHFPIASVDCSLGP